MISYVDYVVMFNNSAFNLVYGNGDIFCLLWGISLADNHQ